MRITTDAEAGLSVTARQEIWLQLGYSGQIQNMRLPDSNVGYAEILYWSDAGHFLQILAGVIEHYKIDGLSGEQVYELARPIFWQAERAPENTDKFCNNLRSLIDDGLLHTLKIGYNDGGVSYRQSLKPTPPESWSRQLREVLSRPLAPSNVVYSLTASGQQMAKFLHAQKLAEEKQFPDAYHAAMNKLDRCINSRKNFYDRVARFNAPVLLAGG